MYKTWQIHIHIHLYHALMNQYQSRELSQYPSCKLGRKFVMTIRFVAKQIIHVLIYLCCNFEYSYDFNCALNISPEEIWQPLTHCIMILMQLVLVLARSIVTQMCMRFYNCKRRTHMRTGTENNHHTSRSRSRPYNTKGFTRCWGPVLRT